MALDSSQYRIRVPVWIWSWMLMYSYLYPICTRHTVNHTPEILSWLSSNITKAKFFGKVKSLLPFLSCARRNNTHCHHVYSFLLQKLFQFSTTLSRHPDAKTVFHACT